MSCSATLLAAVMSILYVASTSRMRIHTDKSHSIVDESDAKNDEDFTFNPDTTGLGVAAPTAHLYAKAISNGEGQGGVEGMSMPQLQAPSYVVGYSDLDVCGQGYQPIANVRHCMDAAKVLGLHYSSVVHWPYAPHGCFTTPTVDSAVSPTVWFNKDAGRETTEGTVICEKGRSGETPQYIVKQTTADEMHWMQHGVQPQRPHAEGSFVQVGAGYCLNGVGSTVDGYSIMTNSLLECKKKCVASEQCQAIEWDILPLLSCTLFNQTFTESSENQVKDLHAWRGPECWNKQASNNSTKSCASASVLQRLLSTVMGMTK